MTGSVFVDPGGAVALDRASLSAPPLGSVGELLDYCDEWAHEVGWSRTTDAAEADAVIVGPDVIAPDGQEVIAVERAQGVDGFRWAIRHLGFTQRWPTETVPYGLIDDQLMDVRRPRRQPRRGVVVLVHGGFWMQAWRRDLMDGLAVDLVERGWETWNVEYGRVGGTGGWPQSRDDVVTAVDRVCDAADTDTVLLVGHSAGAQLALAAARERPDVVREVVSLAGLCDLETARRMRLGGGAVDRFLDGEGEWEASPLLHVPLTARVVLAHCVDDSVVPLELSERYAAAAEAAGGDVALLRIDEGNHMSLIEPERAWRSVLPELRGSPARG